MGVFLAENPLVSKGIAHKNYILEYNIYIYMSTETRLDLTLKWWKAKCSSFLIYMALKPFYVQIFDLDK